MIWLKEKKDMNEKKEQPEFTQEGLEAIEGSMKKWHDILYAGGVDHANQNCPCCARYASYGEGYLDCTNCPIKLYGRECQGLDTTGCGNTPYITHWKQCGIQPHERIKDPMQRKAAQKEFLYLAKVYFWYKSMMLDKAKVAQGERLDALASIHYAATWIGKSESKVRSLKYAHERIDTLNNSTANHFQDVHRRLEDLEGHMKQNSLRITRCFKRLGSLRRTIFNLAETLGVKVED